VAYECTELAIDNVLAARKVLANVHGFNYAKNQKSGDESMAAIRAGADQLPGDDPVRIAALRYVRVNKTYPYFQPCIRQFNLADTAEMKVRLPGATQECRQFAAINQRLSISDPVVLPCVE
jgi:hypothetical protein